MSGTSLIVLEVFVGIVVIMVVGAAMGIVVPRMTGESPPAEEILRRRYARGEVTREQYLKMRDDLGIPAGTVKTTGARETLPAS